MTVTVSPLPAPAACSERVETRRIYYISGFDPRGAAFYHRLYREEAAKQSVLLGARIDVGPRARHTPHSSAWNIDADWNGESVSAEYQFLRWDDIVRKNWEPNLFRLFLTSVTSYAGYIKCGAFRRLRHTFRGPYLSAIYPFGYLLALVLISMLCAYGVGYSVGSAANSTGLAWLSGLGVIVASCWGGIRLASRIAVFWLLRTYLFVYAWGTDKQDLMDRRAKEFADQIIADQTNRPCDEVLVIGHSIGTLLATEVAAHLVDKMPGEQRRNITLVTLGQCIPLLSLIPSAVSFRSNLQRLAEEKDMQWLDMNARADSLCFSYANPLDISGIRGAAIQRPTTQVVRPFRMFNAREFIRIKRNKMRLHFQYLMASELPNEYDYFRMTAGPFRLQPY